MSTATFKRGQFVQVAYNGQTIEAMVLLASENSQSLMLVFAGAVRTPSGGMMLGQMPLLMDDDGVYRDLVENQPASLTPRQVQ
jgi:hypothetical protein